MQLSNDPEAFTSTPSGCEPDHSLFFMTDCDAQKSHVMCKQRLLLACYMLEQQHNLLFGRPAATICDIDLGPHLPLPCSQLVWDKAMTRQLDHPATERIHEALDSVGNSSERPSKPYDTFQSLLVLSCAGDPLWQDVADNDDALSLVMDSSPQVMLAYHTMTLCKNTSVRDLLAVAGESWVMAEKLSTQAEYTAAQLAIRDWASEKFRRLPSAQSPIQRALFHALAILRIQQTTGLTDLLFHEWAIYLAAIVIWASAQATPSSASKNSPRPFKRSSMSHGEEPRSSSQQDLEDAVATFLASGADVTFQWPEAKKVLSWVRAQIENVHRDTPHHCGLASGALDVLGKLIARGHEEGTWF